MLRSYKPAKSEKRGKNLLSFLQELSFLQRELPIELRQDLENFVAQV